MWVIAAGLAGLHGHVHGPGEVGYHVHLITDFSELQWLAKFTRTLLFETSCSH